MFDKKKKIAADNILILGLGGVGYYLAKRLLYEEYAITVIESDPEVIKFADENIDARLIQGNAMDISCWQEANARKINCLIAVTNNDAVNMMAAMIADKFGIKRKIARVRSLQFGNEDSILTAKDLNIDLLINPEELTSQEIVRLIKLRAANEIIDIAKGQIQLMANRIHDSSPFAHKKLKEIAQEHSEFAFRVVAIARGITTIIPGGEDMILPQDQIFIMAGSETLPHLMKLAGVEQLHRQRIMILGGGLIGHRIAQLLEKSVEVKLIEKNSERALQLVEDLKHTEILNGDGSDADVLTSAGLSEMDTFITATGENETNILSCLLAKNLMNKKKKGNGKKKQGKTIALVSKEDYLVLASTIGADLALNKKVMAGNVILKFIRRSELISVAHLHGFDAEVVEIVAAPGSPITKKPLAKLSSLQYGTILIGSVYRHGEWRVAVGNTHIQSNERVIVICLSPQLRDVRKLFQI
ncbi:MAG: Trk system potassium transporter TrkA [Desulfocapsaceae bacterium]|nr:Trk system potassium transporter TrkA [Desulfocapsaceae bacterium]